jgi:hypothetical protein
MNNVKKIAAAVAVAIGTAGSGVVQSDEVDFGYGVSSATVATVLTVADIEDEPANDPTVQNTLHWRYYYKAGANATDNSAICEEVDFSWTGSPNDLVTVSPDEHFGSDTRGILFNDPATRAAYLPAARSLALLRGVTQPIRYKAFVDNNEGNNIGFEGSLVAARATIIEFVNGAAWGYRGYNSLNTGTRVFSDFSEPVEAFGEVIGYGGNLPGPRTDGADVAIKPFDEFATIFFVQPISHLGNTDSTGQQVPLNQFRTNLESQVFVSIEHIQGMTRGDAMFDRDENPVSGNIRQTITCVGAVTIRDLLSEGAELLLEDMGGWTRFKTWQMVRDTDGNAPGSAVGTAANPSRIRTDEVVAQFLEHNDPNGTGTGGTFNGQPVGGVINNGYGLVED